MAAASALETTGRKGVTPAREDSSRRDEIGVAATTGTSSAAGEFGLERTFILFAVPFSWSSVRNQSVNGKLSAPKLSAKLVPAWMPRHGSGPGAYPWLGVRPLRYID